MGWQVFESTGQPGLAKANAAASENEARAEVQLTRPAEARGRRRKERLTRCRDRSGGRAVDADAVVGEILVAGARDVEELGGEIEMAMFTQAERFKQAQIEVEELRLAHAVASGDAAINDRAVVVIVGVVLLIRADDRREGEPGTREENAADRETVGQSNQAVEIEIVAHVLFRPGVFNRKIEGIERDLAREVALVGIVVAVVRERIVGLELKTFRQPFGRRQDRRVVA